MFSLYYLCSHYIYLRSRIFIYFCPYILFLCLHGTTNHMKKMLLGVDNLLIYNHTIFLFA